MGGRSGGRGFSCFKCLCGRRTRHYAFLAIIIFFAGLTIHDVIELVIEYAENPTVTDIDVMMNSSIELPNITFCIDNDYIEANLPPINASAPPEEWDNLVDDALEQMPDRDSFLMNPWPWQVAKDAKAVIMSITSLEREIALKKVAKILNFYKLDGRISSLRDSWKKWEKVIDDRNVTFDEWQNKVGTELMKKVVHRFQRLAADGEKDEYRLKAGMKITWISKNEFCFQTYYTDANYAPIKTPGTFFEFGAHQIEAGAAINPVVIDFHGRRSTQHRAMTSGSSEKNGVNSDINPQEKHKIIGSLQAIYEILPNDDESTACVDREEDDELDDDVETCQDRCRMNMWREACHCSALTTSYLADDDDLKEYPPCHYLDCELDENATLSDADCIKGCVRGCHQVRYHVEHERQGRSAGPNGQPTGETVIEFAWENFEYLHFDQHEEWTFAKFIGELGGSIGIWLGLSVLSLIQITTYFYDFCARRVVREKILKQPSMEIAGDSELSQNPFSNPFKKRSDARKVSQVAPSNGVNAVSNSPNGSSSIDIV